MGVSARVARLLGNSRDEWANLDRRIEAYEDELTAPTCELATSPRIGVVNATALLVAVEDASTFTKERDPATWLGLTPRRRSTAGKISCSASTSEATNAYVSS